MRCLVFGSSGQIGSYLVEELLKNGHEVVGVTRKVTYKNKTPKNVDYKLFSLLEGDVSDPFFVQKEIAKKYDIVYGLAAQSSVGLSFDQPYQTFSSGVMGIVNILESIRQYSSATRFFNASSSEMYGEGVINENSPMRPHSPYGISKAAAHNMVSLYREQFGIRCCSGILFNTESPRREGRFVTKKIIDYLRVYDFAEPLRLGDIDVVRDWTHAKDVAHGIYLMSTECKKDYVISNGRPYSIREFLEQAFIESGLTHKDIQEKVLIDRSLFRPSEVKANCGDAFLIKSELGWTAKYQLIDIIKDMLYG